MVDTNILEKLRENGFSWEIKGSKVTYKYNGEKSSAGAIKPLLGSIDKTATIADLEELIKQEKAKAGSVDGPGEIVYVDLPKRESIGDCEINVTDLEVWKDIKFVRNDDKTFYVKDSDNANTFTRILSSSNNSDLSDAKIIKEAFYHKQKTPEYYVKKFIVDNYSGGKIGADFADCMYDLPATAWDYIQIQGVKYGKDAPVIYKRLFIESGKSIDLYKGFIKMEGEFRRSAKCLIEKPRNITNDPTIPALAYIDLNSIPGSHSDLWDEFLLQRLHKESYVSIFKAWIYSLVVGENNTRQIMWLYGNGGTGKGCMCKAIMSGLEKLTGKDICLAISKDTGKSNFNAEVLNKHLAIYPDAKNLKSTMSEHFHNITGDDPMRIEGKSKEIISERIYMIVLVCANDRPQCDMTDRSQSSRFILMPFTLDDDEMKKSGLMDEFGQLKGSNKFTKRLEDEFMNFLGSCKEHYLKRCPTGSNIDAHEALGELETINLDSIRLVEEFIDDYFEITSNPKDRITQKDFRRHCVKAFTTPDDDDGIKIYKDLTIDDVKDYLQKKYNFEWKRGRIGQINTGAILSVQFGIKLKNNNETPTNTEAVFDDDVEF